jgi:DNA polymerase I-like protein with 3'-5' exonuclease and polymerase domains
LVGDTLYPTFHIKGTQTDRMTSSKPAIQTIPKPVAGDKEDDADFRAAFTPPEGYDMLVGDFSQFEMRLMAAEAREEHLIKAFIDDIDTHAVTAIKTMGRQIRRAAPEFADMSEEQLLDLLVAKDGRLKRYRDRAKVLNFGIAYGATEWGVARLASVAVDEARSLITAFHEAYPSLSKDIKKTHAAVNLLREEMGRRGYAYAKLGKVRHTTVQNRVGLTRCFELPLRLTRILMRLAESPNITKYLPMLGRLTNATVRYYDEDRMPEQVVRSQLRSAARKLQSYVQRQAYNFRIQSLGAYYTKQLQVELARWAIPPGVHCAATLPVLPGINVHDEIHLYVRSDVEACRREVATFMQTVTEDLGVPIVFDLAVVGSWADKA